VSEADGVRDRDRDGDGDGDEDNDKDSDKEETGGIGTSFKSSSGSGKSGGLSGSGSSRRRLAHGAASPEADTSSSMAVVRRIQRALQSGALKGRKPRGWTAVESVLREQNHRTAVLEGPVREPAAVSNSLLRLGSASQTRGVPTVRRRTPGPRPQSRRSQRMLQAGQDVAAGSKRRARVDASGKEHLRGAANPKRTRVS